MVKLNEFASVAITFVVIAIIIGIGGTVLDEVQETQCDYNFDDGECRACNNATVTTYNATGNFCENSSDTNQQDAYTVAQETSFNATGSGLTGIGTFGDWLPTVAVVLVSALVIGIIAAYFYMKR